ncbi:hypothetical protein XFF6970_490056 [Xanthomonas citri pv. fuscans]|nr:hypothetical protein XFF6970_490056 [Xanthomonas citri pv. fuscans]
MGNDGSCQRPHPPFGHLLPQAGEGREPVCPAAPEWADSHTQSASRIPHPASRIPHPASRIPNPESRIPNPESRIPNPESRIPALEPYRTVWYVRHVLPPNHGCIAVAAGPSRPGFAWETAA